MNGFYHIWASWPSWSCDLDFLYTHWFPLPIDASYKIWLWLAKRFQRRSLKLWTDGRTTDGRKSDHGHPISSPCEPNGSGELKSKKVYKIIDVQDITIQPCNDLVFKDTVQYVLRAQLFSSFMKKGILKTIFYKKNSVFQTHPFNISTKVVTL